MLMLNVKNSVNLRKRERGGGEKKSHVLIFFCEGQINYSMDHSNNWTLGKHPRDDDNDGVVQNAQVNFIESYRRCRLLPPPSLHASMSYL
jgi:hypothetical protein